ncbi:amidase [Phenylobacterium sp.]|uniref:amidase n=1 Tax=Phenylobacterium sp. TaxID=1871053 RepID=UPI0037C7D275
MNPITRRALGAIGVAGVATQAFANSPAIRSAWPDATETAAMIRSGQMSALEAAKAAVDRAERLQPKLNFLVASDFDRALERGQIAAMAGAFAGVPFLIKDLDDYKGLPTRSGSRAMLRMPLATQQDALIDAYDRAGVNVIGKSSTPEYGFLPTTEPIGFGPTRNPWDPTRSSGGSSGGAAAATAAGVVPFAHASDGGGSIRIPASCCGLFGLKPSRGRMLAARGQTQVSDISVSHVLTRSVRDSAAMFALTEDSGPGAKLAAVGLITAPLRRRLRVGLILNGGAGKPPTAEVRAATDSSVKLMESLGHEVVPTTWPTGEDFINDFLLLWAAGAADLAGVLNKVMGHPPGPDLLEDFSLGMAEMAAKAPKDALPKTVQRLQASARAYDRWFMVNRFDVILSPVLASPPPQLGYVAPNVSFDTLISRLIEYVGYTTLHNVAGAPSMSVPLNWTSGGLPVGTQFSARAGAEGLLFQLAYQLEAARPWADRTPRLHA